MTRQVTGFSGAEPFLFSSSFLTAARTSSGEGSNGSCRRVERIIVPFPRVAGIENRDTRHSFRWEIWVIVLGLSSSASEGRKEGIRQFFFLGKALECRRERTGRGNPFGPGIVPRFSDRSKLIQAGLRSGQAPRDRSRIFQQKSQDFLCNERASSRLNFRDIRSPRLIKSFGRRSRKGRRKKELYYQ